jgi:hypothetical protein
MICNSGQMTGKPVVIPRRRRAGRAWHRTIGSYRSQTAAGPKGLIPQRSQAVDSYEGITARALTQEKRMLECASAPDGQAVCSRPLKTVRTRDGRTLVRHTREFYSWSNMISRCRNENHHAYENYGARGIRVCERWLPDGTGRVSRISWTTWDRARAV